MHNWLLIMPLLALATAKPQVSRTGDLFECNGKCDLPCSKNLYCKTNVRALDKCGCCEVCVENENGTCGGPRNLFGLCADGLICELMEKTDVGKCKKAPQKLSCESLTCDPYESCVMEGGVPKCKCVYHCDNDATDDNVQYCDVEGNEYQNLCEVHKKICENKIEFFYLSGKCQGCRDGLDGKEYSHGAIVIPATEKTPCQEDWCNHGSIMTRLNKDCLNEMNFNCTIRASNTNDIGCPNGFSCHVSKWSDKPDLYPHLGICREVNEKKCYHQGKEHNLNTEFISEDCKRRCTCAGWNNIDCVSLCPPIDITCQDDEIKVTEPRKVEESHCNCNIPVCKKKEIVCAMKAESGHCYAYFKKWHFNLEKQECVSFIYGGCGGNENRFNTKEECEKTCLSSQVPLPLIEAAPLAAEQPKRSFKWPISRPRKPILSDIQMVLKGKIKFNGVKKVLRTPSCLFITFADVSIADAPSVVIKTKRFDLSGYDTSVDYDYELETPKPAENQLWRTYTASAIIHRNRCPENRQSVNVGDFLTDTRHQVKLTKYLNSYDQDINVICYDCKEDDDKEIVINDETPVLRHPPIVKVELDSNKYNKILLKPGCEFEGSIYKINEEFISSNCTVKCTCDETNAVSCTPLCSIQPVVCKDNELKASINQTVSKDSNCQCPFEYCLRPELKKDECEVDGEKFKVGERFISKSCTGYCKCTGQHSYSCVSLCPPVFVSCGIGEIESTHEEPTMRPECNCTRPTCIPDPYFKPMNSTLAMPLIINTGDESDSKIIEEFVDEGEWSNAEAPDVQLEPNKTIELKGEIEFTKPLGKLPEESCIKFKLEDVSLADGSSFVVGQVKQDLAGVEIIEKYKYSIRTPKPIEEDLHDMFAISATLFIGKCPENDTFEENDFYTDTMFMVKLRNDSDIYENITMHLKENIKPPVPPSIEIPRCVNLVTKALTKEGEKWDEGDCRHCSCSNGSRICIDDVCTDKCDSQFVIHEPGKCCPTCILPPTKNCFEKSTNITREHGSSWKKDDCTSCLCRHGQMFCYGQKCSPVMCKNPVKIPGKCCPECLEQQCFDSTTNRTYKNQEMWVRSDGCTRCMCIGNKPMCASPMCYLESCDDGVSHVTVKGICCPVCANKKVCRTNDGRAFLEGRFWHDENCQVCSCSVDGIECVASNFDTENCTGRVVQLSMKCGKICVSEDGKKKENANVKTEENDDEDDDDKKDEKEEEEEEEFQKEDNVKEDIFP